MNLKENINLMKNKRGGGLDITTFLIILILVILLLLYLKQKGII